MFLNSSAAASAFFSRSPSQSNILLPIHCHDIDSSRRFKVAIAASGARLNEMADDESAPGSANARFSLLVNINNGIVTRRHRRLNHASVGLPSRSALLEFDLILIDFKCIYLNICYFNLIRSGAQP